jgi:hypothetical protein
VPEPKTAKNRLHLDHYVSEGVDPADRWTTIRTEVDRLGALGATVVATVDDHHVVMADPEDNEFCVA